MRVIIYEHNDQDGPEEVDIPDAEIPPPVRFGHPHFRSTEGYWLIPPVLMRAESVLKSALERDRCVLTIDGAEFVAAFGRGLDRASIRSRGRVLRGRKLRPSA